MLEGKVYFAFYLMKYRELISEISEPLLLKFSQMSFSLFNSQISVPVRPWKNKDFRESMFTRLDPVSSPMLNSNISLLITIIKRKSQVIYSNLFPKIVFKLSK